MTRILRITAVKDNLPAPNKMAVDIPDDKRDKRSDPTTENDHRSISMKRPNPMPKTRGPS